MFEKLSFIVFKFFLLFDNVLKFFLKKSLLIYWKDFIEKKAYKKIEIAGTKVNFFCPNQLIDWRIETLFSKEPETLEWIDSFEKKDGLIFWDIGANIGIYSIYNAIKNKNSETVCFEPSTSNLRTLSRNIYINNLSNRIKIFSLPLSNKENNFFSFQEGHFIEGGALNSYGVDYDHEGKKFESKMKYELFGTSINYLLKNKLLNIPDYIKIDVDGIEHLILEGGNQFLSHKKIKSVLVEINENFSEQYLKVIDILNKNNFRILHKKHNEKIFNKRSKFFKTFNYIFIKENKS